MSGGSGGNSGSIWTLQHVPQFASSQQQQQFMTVEGVVLRPCGLSFRPTDQGAPNVAPPSVVALKKGGITLMSAH